MDTMLQRHSAKHIYIIPDGLSEIMSDISREVLRMHPEDIYTFIADYLDALIITRENARVAARLVQSITEISNVTFSFLQTIGMSRDETQHVVWNLRKSFRKHLFEQPVVCSEDKTKEVEDANVVFEIMNEAAISPEVSEEASKIIQDAFRSYKETREKEKELLSGVVDWRVAARSAIRLYRNTGVTNEEAHRAATLIKAAYKGYYTRRLKMKKQQQEVHLDKRGVTSEKVKSEDTKRDEKKFNFVDFDDAKTIQFGKELSTPNVIVASAIDNILDQAIQMAEERESVINSPKGEQQGEEGVDSEQYYFDLEEPRPFEPFTNRNSADLSVSSLNDVEDLEYESSENLYFAE